MDGCRFATNTRSRSSRILLEMIRDRAYVVDGIDGADGASPDVMFVDAMQVAFEKKSTTVTQFSRGPEVALYFHYQPGINIVRRVIEDCHVQGVKHILIIVAKNPTPAAKGLMAKPLRKVEVATVDESPPVVGVDDIEFGVSGKRKRRAKPKPVYEYFPVELEFEWFHVNQFLLNPKHHKKQPPSHLLRRKDEIDALLRQRRATYNQLPAILECDALARYYNAKSPAIFVFQDAGSGVTVRAVREVKS